MFFQIEVTIASIYGKEPVKTCTGIVITPDVALSDVDKDAYDAIILPGGEGHVNLAASALVGELLRNQYDKGKLVGTICMSAQVLLAHGIGYGRKITSYPYKIEALKEKYIYSEDAVVVDGNLITSRGPGTVYAYATKIVEMLVGVEKAKRIAELSLVFDLY